MQLKGLLICVTLVAAPCCALYSQSDCTNYNCLRAQLKQLITAVRQVAFSPDGNLVISCDEKMIKWRLARQNPTGQSWSFAVHQNEDILNYKLMNSKLYILTISDIKTLGVRALSESMCLENSLYRYSSLELKTIGVQIEPDDELEKAGGTAQTERVNRF